MALFRKFFPKKPLSRTTFTDCGYRCRLKGNYERCYTLLRFIDRCVCGHFVDLHCERIHLTPKHSWNKQHRHVCNEAQAWYRAKGSIPAWTERDEIKAIFAFSRFMNEHHGRFEVDHIIPLNDPNVSGLHCSDNLRVIPMRDNRERSARYFDVELQGIEYHAYGYY